MTTAEQGLISVLVLGSQSIACVAVFWFEIVRWTFWTFWTFVACRCQILIATTQASSIIIIIYQKEKRNQFGLSKDVQNRPSELRTVRIESDRPVYLGSQEYQSNSRFLKVELLSERSRTNYIDINFFQKISKT